jgi:hypothetical protein
MDRPQEPGSAINQDFGPDLLISAAFVRYSTDCPVFVGRYPDREFLDDIHGSLSVEGNDFIWAGIDSDSPLRSGPDETHVVAPNSQSVQYTSDAAALLPDV